MIFKIKLQLVLTLSLLIVNSIFAQTNFEKGTFTTNNNETVNCFIKNIDWKNNPTEFKYKLTEDGKIKSGDIEFIKSFGVDGISKYIRATVNIDKSSSNVNNLSANKNPKLEEEQLFLKVYFEGKANLYYYEEGNLKRFFYSTKEKEITQLIYKEYLFGTNSIGENNQYKQQLSNTLKCDNVTIKNIRNVDYNGNDLTAIFEKYNNCVQGTEAINYNKKDKKDLFNFRAKLGVGLASLSINNRVSSSRDTNFDNEFIYRFGGELEMILPFNNNKWALIVEPSYQSYSSNTYIPNSGTVSLQNRTKVEVNYSTIEIPVGARHYFFLNDESKIFVNAFYTLIYTNNSSIEFSNGTELELEKAAGQSIGVGYSYKKFSLECRYELTREVFSNYKSWRSDYNQLSLIFGYQIF